MTRISIMLGFCNHEIHQDDLAVSDDSEDGLEDDPMAF